MRLARAASIRRRVEEACEPQIGIGCYGTLAIDDLADAQLRYADFLGQTVLGDAHRLQEFFIEQFARRYRSKTSSHRNLLL
jgi:hypothetical protein